MCRSVKDDLEFDLRHLDVVEGQVPKIPFQGVVYRFVSTDRISVKYDVELWSKPGSEPKPSHSDR